MAAAGPLSALARAIAPRPRPFSTDPYLLGPNAPRRDELDLTDLPVTGVIPPELAGTYVRNGRIRSSSRSITVILSTVTA